MLTATYSALCYRIYTDDEMIHESGNSPHDSQVYVPAHEGVGKRTMKAYCLITLHEMVAERSEECEPPVYDPGVNICPQRLTLDFVCLNETTGCRFSGGYCPLR